MDCRIMVPRLDADDLTGPGGEPSSAVRARVADARSRQHRRGVANRDLRRSDLDAMEWEAEATALLREAVAARQLSARGWDRVRRLARTIADLAGSDIIGYRHVAEAVSLRGTP
jgi:magnesium chelatase family protein